ncbi:pentapeptide repeat-containing protein [Micromonospora sp. KC207]|uniref:pentapeptide repeat-containing protein n=1 Tax=Micromonospora sp. KC207 TaxID=2530377 RepID=UPI001FB791B8|nr:pentapeptide repeat-containing protein [Micromonospora sp. KC207]
MSETAPPGPRDELRADCARCFGLCCVAPAFAASSDFALDKPAGQPCPNLGDGFGCGIHRDLRARGFAGCTVFDCFGAGQQVAQVTFAGRDWRTAPRTATRMFEAFAVMRPLHELLWYLTQAVTLTGPGPLRAELEAALAETRRLTGGSARELLALDVDAHRGRVNPLLLRTSELARGDRAGADRRGAVLVAADLRRADLVGANLRGAVLLGADLRGADLTLADLTGVDLRGADVRGADLSGALFLHQSQVDAAGGDDRTGLAPALVRPTHWSRPVAPVRWSLPVAPVRRSLPVAPVRRSGGGPGTPPLTRGRLPADGAGTSAS